MSIPQKNADGTKDGTFGFVLSPREGQRLRRELAAAHTPVKVSVTIDATIAEAPFQSFVEAVIRGSEIHDQDIVLTGHIQEERFSANDDGSGLANGLEIGRALKKAIDEGRLPRPKRDVTLLVVRRDLGRGAVLRDGLPNPASATRVRSCRRSARANASTRA